jgi:hypothetical protein
LKQYKYTLDAGSKKFVCPRCNKKTFVRFIDTETKTYLNDELGRCDRETSCRYYNTPKRDLKNTFEDVFKPPPEPNFHATELVGKSGRNYQHNNFVLFLKTLFTDAQVKEAILKYLIGTSKYWNGATVFWQIDDKIKARHGKIMLFNSETGKRVKDKNGRGLINSVRSALRLKDFNLNQCLFGLHLITETNQKTIALVEGEKTAVIMSIFKPEYTWIATGGKHGLKYDFLKPIKQYKIIAFPDKSEYNEWLHKAKELNILGFKIVVNDWLEQQSKYETGADLADVYLNGIKEAEPPFKVEVVSSVPELLTVDKILNDWKQKGAEIDLFLKELEIERNEIIILNYKTEVK